MTTDTNNDQSPTAALAAPVAQTARIQSIDIMRGVALLGILVMNVQAFVMPFAAYMNPNAYGSLEGRHYWVWYFSHLFFDMKFMSIFSMLFGAGVILLTTRLEQTGRPPARIHYRRTFFLLLIGLVHCYILWTGDILVPYAVCAAVVYLFRRRRPLTLIGIGVVFIAVASGMNALDGINLKNIQNLASTAQTSQVDNADSAAIEQHGDEPIPEDDESVPGTGADSDTSTSDDDGSPVEQSGSPWEMTPEKAVETLAMRQAFWNPTEEQIQEEVTAMRGSWWTDIAYRAPFNAMMHAFFIPFFLIWRAGGLMLIGMGLFKLGCFLGTVEDEHLRGHVARGVGHRVAVCGIWRAPCARHRLGHVGTSHGRRPVQLLGQHPGGAGMDWDGHVSVPRHQPGLELADAGTVSGRADGLVQLSAAHDRVYDDCQWSWPRVLRSD